MSLSFKEMQNAIDLVVSSGHVPNIVGLQGIGKSDLVADFCNKKGYLLNTITCSLLQEGDMAMPYLCDGDVKYAVNAIITNFEEKCERKCKEGILFLDEFNRPRSPQVQSELMNLVLQRRIVGHDVSHRIKLVLAMNPSSEMEGYEDTDYSVSFSDNAILGRIVFLNMVPNLPDWLAYARQKDSNGRYIINDYIFSFLQRNKPLFITNEVSGKINNTPRGWSRASDILYTWESTGEVGGFRLLSECLSGTLEKRSVDLFINYYKSQRKGINYSVLANEILDSNNIVDTLKKKGNLTTVQLDALFNTLIGVVYERGSISDKSVNNLVEFLLSVSRELLYAWILVMQKEHSSIYEGLILECEKFSARVLELLNDVVVEKKGGFSGK